MKKIIDFLVNILLAIVYPNRILSLFRVKNLDQNSNKILGNDNIVKILALVIAVGFVFAVRYTPPSSANHREVLANQPVEMRIGEGYTYFGSPIPTVDVILSGDQTDIDILRATGGIRLFVDLSRLEPGEYPHDNIPIGYELVGVEGQVTVTVNPGAVSGIQIDRYETREFPVEVYERNFPDLDIRYIREVSVQPEYVEISGPARILDQIYNVRVPFDHSEIAPEPTDITHPGFIVANDIDLHTISGGIEFHQEVVQVRLVISQNTRRIGVELSSQPLAGIPLGYEITDIRLGIDEIEVWGGSFEDMEAPIILPRINFTSLDDNGQITVQVQPFLLNGVYSNIDEIDITVIYDPPPPEPTEAETDDDLAWIGEKDRKRRIT